MSERLKAFFAELEKNGVFIDENRMIGSLKFSGNLCAGFATSGKEDQFEENDEYFFASFRALSMTIFPWRDLVLDFSQKGMLKKATKLFQGLTIYKDHITSVDNWVGLVVQSRWDENEKIPAGINVRLRLDKKWNEKTVDGVRSGAIHSVSAGVMFEYKKSHPDLADFWYMQGEKVNDEIVRLIVTNIVSADELSLVWQGADSFAKRIDFSKGDTGSGPDPEEGENNNATGKSDLGKNNKFKTGGKKMFKLARVVALAFGLVMAKYGFGPGIQEVELDEGMQAVLMDDLVDLNKKNTEKLETQQKIFTSLFGEKAEGDLSDLAENMRIRAAAGDAHLESVRKEALKFAKLAEGKTDDAKFEESAMGKIILGADMETAVQLRDDYQVKAEAAFPAVCSACGAKLTRGSAHKQNQGQNDDTVVNEEDYQY